MLVFSLIKRLFSTSKDSNASSAALASESEADCAHDWVEETRRNPDDWVSCWPQTRCTKCGEIYPPQARG